MSVATGYEHIVLDERGVALIAGTTMKVLELVAETTAYGWSPEELHFQHPYLSMGQIYSALAYYWDHRDQIHADLARRLEKVDRLRQASGPSPLVTRLKAEGLL
jgi:uncharacterized protein (DUF433 family)